MDRTPIVGSSKLMYQLKRETAQDGSIYYSSLNGAVSMLPREPRSVQMHGSVPITYEETTVEGKLLSVTVSPEE